MATSSSEIPSLQGKVVICKEKKGVFQGSSIFCHCCNGSFSPSSWEAHCGGNWHRPWQYIFLEETGLNILYYKNQMHALQASTVVQSKRRAKEKAELKQTEERNAISKKRSRNGNNDGKEFVDSEEDADFSLSDSWRPVNQKPKSQRSKIRKQSSTDADDNQDIYNSKDSLSPESSSPLDGLAHADEAKIPLNLNVGSVTYTPLVSNSILSHFMQTTFQQAHSLPYGVITSAGIDFEASLLDPVNRVFATSIPADDSADAIFSNANLLVNDFLLSFSEEPKKESIQQAEFVHSVFNP